MRRHSHRHSPGIARRFTSPAVSFFVIGIASLLWLVVRTGTKPSRAVYPCQRAAAANVSAWAGAAVLPVLMPSPRPVLARGRLDGTGDSAFSGLTRAACVVLLAAIALPASEAATALYSEARMLIPTAQANTVRLRLQDNLVGPATFSDIHAVNGTTGADDGVARLIASLERDGPGFYRRPDATAGLAGTDPGARGVVGPDDVVLIKINSQWDKRGGTNTDLVRALVLAIADHPDGFTGEIVIADNGQDQFGSRGGGGSMDWRDNNAIDRSRSIADVVSELAGAVRVSAYLWDTITRTRVAEFDRGDYTDGYVVSDQPAPSTGIIVSYPKFTTGYGTRISFARGVWDAGSRTYDDDRLTVLNVPVLKSHAIYGVTAAVKHYMGVVSDKLTSHNAHRSVASGGMGTQMALTRLPDLNIIDAIWVNARPGNGPGTNYRAATEVNVIAASRDPVALDVWAAEQVLIPTARDLGLDGTERMDPRLRDSRGFGEWLALSARALQEAGHDVTMDWREANVRIVGSR